MNQKPENTENYKILLQREVGKLKLGKAKYNPGDWNTTHRHENPRFVFVLQGTFFEKYERKERFCKPSTAIFRPPLEKHSEVYEKGVVCLSVDIDPAWLKRLEDFSVKLERSNSLRNQTLTQLITKVADEMFLEDDASALAIDSLLTEIAVEMFRNPAEAQKEKSPIWLKNAVEYIHANFSKNLSLNEIANVARVHPVHLSRVFRKGQYCTIAEYIRRLRIETARELLVHSDLTLAQIATQVGFADQSHFTKIFKRLTRKTPGQFKRKMQKSLSKTKMFDRHNNSF